MAKTQEPETAEATSTDIDVAPQSRVVTTDGHGAIVTIDDLRRMINEAEEESAESAELIEAQIFEKMLQAKNLEELLGPNEVTKWNTLIDESVYVTGVRFNRSDFGEGPAIYAIAEARVDGKQALLSCGARTVMAQLLIMRDREMLPALVKLQESPRPTKSGYKPLNLAVGDAPEEPF